MADRVYDILLVEDHAYDVRLTRKALQRLSTPSNLHVAVDGVEAMLFLTRQGRYADAVRPHLVLLDLNMPRKDGRAVLREIKTDPVLKTIPVVVLTTSSASHDVQTAYDLHANGYISKPVSFSDFVMAIEAVERFWLRTALLP